MMEYYAAIQRNEILTHATLWMNLENIRLRDKQQTQRTHIVWFYLYDINGKSVETESR